MAESKYYVIPRGVYPIFCPHVKWYGEIAVEVDYQCDISYGVIVKLELLHKLAQPLRQRREFARPALWFNVDKVKEVPKGMESNEGFIKLMRGTEGGEI